MHKVLQKMRDASTAVKSSAYLHRITMHEMQKREMQGSEMKKKNARSRHAFFFKRLKNILLAASCA